MSNDLCNLLATKCKIVVKKDNYLSTVEETKNGLSMSQLKMISILSNHFKFDKQEAINILNDNMFNVEHQENKEKNEEDRNVKTEAKEVKELAKPFSTLIDLIDNEFKNQNNNQQWVNSPLKNIVKLKSNDIGRVGENYLDSLCKKLNFECEIDGTKTKEKGGGAGDGIIKDKTIEIKTAHIGKSKSFQHELGEKPWKADYMTFIDIDLTCIYLTIFKNFTEKEYKSGEKCKKYFPTRKITWRKKMGAFKLDTNMKINKNSITEGYCIKIDKTTEYNDIKDFIEKSIK